jgi:uncharacterized membrane protein
MHMSEVTLIGWIHTVASMAAIVFGAWNIVAVKGGGSHKSRGNWYAATMVVAMVLSLGVYRFDLPVVPRPNSAIGGFGIFHWLAVAALVLTVIGYYSASRQARGFWAYGHPVAMTLSYYLLIGGLINELFVRVNVLRPFAFIVVHGKPVFGTTRAVEMTHHANELATLFLLILFVVKVWRYRHHRNSTAVTPDPV